MIKPNWDVFKVKFHDNPQKNLEWLCYLLFCKEFDKPRGLFRYKNQAAIETEPIAIGDEVIGWQAKYYDTSLSKNKSDLIKTLEGAKKYHPTITKLLIYTNQAWGQSKGKPPKALQDIERKAKQLQIAIIWNTASFFESEFVTSQCETVASHFFTLESSLVDKIRELQKHTENVLHEIRVTIPFGKKNVEINRDSQIASLIHETHKVTILSGRGGVGKTALIKTLFEKVKGKIPFYVFKASEFEIGNVNVLLNGTSFSSFSAAHEEEPKKYIVIDSAEKLLDLKNHDPFKEFLSILVRDNWNVIFTTRDNYLEDLNYQFFEVYNIVPLNITLKNLDTSELKLIAETNEFKLPRDEKLLDLIHNPFYLNEYLKFYLESHELNYSEFKSKLWSQNIKKSKHERERCFLEMAFERANNGRFYVNAPSTSEVLDSLVKDGILGYETPGYFITHDIYEEWALEKVIEREFVRRTKNQDFFENIGSSLPIRRSFRKWLSEELQSEDDKVQAFIEESVSDKETLPFWKDEVFVSILLSDYSERFFTFFKEALLSGNNGLLKRLSFILRLACKEIDTDFFEKIGEKSLNLFSLAHVLTKPKGQGWQVLIRFVFENLEFLGIESINFILPVLHDWNSKSKTGPTTRFASLIALRYYQWHLENDRYFRRDETKDQILQTILYGASEIKNELKEIFDQVIEKKWKQRRDPYYHLSDYALTKLEGMLLAHTIPECILKLAALFWTYTPPEDDEYYHDHGMGVEQYFGIEDNHMDYFPPSAYQTPVYWLLQADLKKTIDFILDFTNKTVEHYAKNSKLSQEVEGVDVFIDGHQTAKQYISNRLWCTYRGTQGAPHVLESIHMALEKFLLENAKNTDSAVLEGWLLYLLKNTKSASISSLVASIFTAYPEKTFDVAKVLFRTKEFFLYDTARYTLDYGKKEELLSFRDFFRLNSKNDLYDNERIEAADKAHRKSKLEDQFLNYQFFRSSEISDEEATQRQEVLWQILDDYYSKLPPPSEQTAHDKIWRMYLARMDRRKINPEFEKTDKGTVIRFKPDLEPELNEYSEASVAASAELYEYSSLRLWASYKLSAKEEYKAYTQFENNPRFALEQAKILLEEIKGAKQSDETFMLFNQTIPLNVCAALIRHHMDELNDEDKNFCKDAVLEAVSFSIDPRYQYQVSDGMLPAISTLPSLLSLFPEEKDVIKSVLVLSLFNEQSIDMAGTQYNKAAIIAINKLWEQSHDDAESLLFGYLTLKPRRDALLVKMRKASFKKGNHQLDVNQFFERFIKQNESHFEKIAANPIEFLQLDMLKNLDLGTLATAFELLPNGTKQSHLKDLASRIISLFAKASLRENKRDTDSRLDYEVKTRFLEKLAYFVLSSDEKDIQQYLAPFLEDVNSSEFLADLFKNFISAEDTLHTHTTFWFIWKLFKDKVFESCKKGEGYWYRSELIQGYLFARNFWKESARDWYTFKEQDRRFFNDISLHLGHCPSTLFAIAKLLSTIGAVYANDGIVWIANIVKNNPQLQHEKLVTDTLYYLEKYLRKLIYELREQIKTTKALRDTVVTALNFLVEQGSVVGYMLRESIL